MIQTLIKHFEIPEKCFLNKTLFKKLFQENADLDITDKKALKDDIEKIRWLYTLKPSTIKTLSLTRMMSAFMTRLLFYKSTSPAKPAPRGSHPL